MNTPAAPISRDHPDMVDLPDLSDLSELLGLSELAPLPELADPTGSAEPTALDTPVPSPRTASPTPATAAPVNELSTLGDGELSADQRDLLAFERRWWRYPGAKEQAIRERFGFSPTRYYQTLNALLDQPAALAHDPSLVNRLRRLRTSRLRARAPR